MPKETEDINISKILSHLQREKTGKSTHPMPFLRQPTEMLSRVYVVSQPEWDADVLKRQVTMPLPGEGAARCQLVDSETPGLRATHPPHQRCDPD